MMATIGYITPEYYKFEGTLSFSQNLKFADVPNGLKAIGAVPVSGWTQIFLAAGFWEVSAASRDPSRAPGDYNWKLLTADTEEGVKRKLNAELANGRLAMMAIMGMMFQDGLTGSAWGDWALYTDSPLRAFENELGVQAPVGFWDPLGFTKDGDVDVFRRRRETELKHGRVCMFATLGYMVPEYVRFPGDLSPMAGLKFNDVPNGLQALSKVPFLGWTQIFVFIGLIEGGFYVSDPTRAPGDFERGGVLGVPNATTMMPGEDRTRKLQVELANGRLAMVAIMGMMFQDGVVGSTGPAMWLGSSAFENELGVQPPVGFWDPLGFTADGNVEDFARRRQTELKHGRVSMLACMGYITPEVTGKFPGYLSPSSGLRFEDVPNGLGALSKVPALGWAQIFAYGAFCELSQDQSPGTPGAKGEFGFTVLTSSDPAEKEKKLKAEIANGRLAMMAIIGMFFQDGLTGSAWGDWALYTDSPLRAAAAADAPAAGDFSNELGACPPLGYWDPLGLAKAPTPEQAIVQFRRRRAVELQHGRVSMYACIGYIVQEFVRWPGMLSPSRNISFEDVPNGLAALSKVPIEGWTQIAGLCGIVEISNLSKVSDGRLPGDFEGWGAYGLLGGKPLENKERRDKALLAEINNGRLAMVAIIGMFFQDGLTGSAWGDWALYTASPLR
jgi:hypothetical protein